jgi:polysaccharide export outer membrane protein
MRQVDGNLTRTEIPVDLKKLLAGKMPDLALKADDILFVPASTAKAIAARTGEAAISIGSSIAIYSHPF